MGDYIKLYRVMFYSMPPPRPQLDAPSPKVAGQTTSGDACRRCRRGKQEEAAHITTEDASYRCRRRRGTQEEAVHTASEEDASHCHSHRHRGTQEVVCTASEDDSDYSNCVRPTEYE